MSSVRVTAAVLFRIKAPTSRRLFIEMDPSAAAPNFLVEFNPPRRIFLTHQETSRTMRSLDNEMLTFEESFKIIYLKYLQIIKISLPLNIGEKITFSSGQGRTDHFVTAAVAPRPLRQDNERGRWSMGSASTIWLVGPLLWCRSKFCRSH